MQVVLKTIKKEGLELNEDKSVYDIIEVQFLGHVVSTKGIYPDPGKVKVIKSFRAPQNKEELQILLGLAIFVSRFIPNISVNKPFTRTSSKYNIINK